MLDVLPDLDPPVNPAHAKWIAIFCWALFFGIRIHPQIRSLAIPIAKGRSGVGDIAGVTLFAFSATPLLLWCVTGSLSFANYHQHRLSLGSGILLALGGCWLYFRTHVDLGKHFSGWLDIRNDHRLVTHGMYQHIRHPMYLAGLVFLLGQALIVPNWIAAPAPALGLLLLIALRLRSEEQMMIEEFGSQYEDYCNRSRRLIPGLY